MEDRIVSTHFKEPGETRGARDRADDGREPPLVEQEKERIGATGVDSKPRPRATPRGNGHEAGSAAAAGHATPTGPPRGAATAVVEPAGTILRFRWGPDGVGDAD